MTRTLHILWAVALCSAAAGLLVGVAEAVRLAMTGAPLGQLLLIAPGFAAAVGLIAGTPLVLAAMATARTAGVARWLAAARRPGPDRVAAWVHAALAAAATVAFAVVVIRLTVYTYGRFNAPGAVGLLHAAVLTAAALLAVLAVSALAPPLGRLAARRELLTRITSGVAGWAASAAIVLALIALAYVIGKKAAPAADVRPAATTAGFVILLALAWRIRLADRLSTVARSITSAVLLAAMVCALITVGQADRARTAVASGGIIARPLLLALWALSDSDGDGFPARFGGADCDDGNRRVHPGATEIPGNGIDDNCAGGDLTADMLAKRQAPVASERPRNGHNVIVLTIDAVRADHTSAYGYDKPTTPTLEKLAARGTRFDWAITASPTTRRAIPSLMTGRYISTLSFKESDKHWPPSLNKGYRLLGESFKKAGYDTHAVLCCTTLFDKKAGVVDGIDRVDASAVRIKTHRAEHLADRAISLLSKRSPGDPPLFLWMHFLDPHNPYQQPPGSPDFGGGEIGRYDAEIWWVDHHIGRIVDALEQNGMADSTVLVVSADHGDEFMEHGNRFHGRTLYTESVRVPLIVAAPGGSAQTVAEPVSVIDVGATVLDLVGIDRPAGQNGQSLAGSVLTGEAPPDRMVLSELIADRNIVRNLKAGFYRGWHVIWDLDAGSYELYDLGRDPGNRHDLASDKADVLIDMRRRLEATIDVELTPLPGEKKPALPPSPHRLR